MLSASYAGLIYLNCPPFVMSVAVSEVRMEKGRHYSSGTNGRPRVDRGEGLGEWPRNKLGKQNHLRITTLYRDCFKMKNCKPRIN